MFASDIHGSALWCERLIEQYRSEKAERLFLLGDILYHGPRNDLPDGFDPKGVISMLNGIKGEVLSVRGNCDAEVDQMVLDFPALAEYSAVFADGIMLFLSHGHIYNPDTLPPLKTGDVLINGHTHIPRAEIVEGIHCLNVGSAALPKENTPHSFAIYEDGLFIFKEIGGGEFLRHRVKA